MARKKLAKEETEKEINLFFKNIKNKNQREIKKIKRLAMRHNIKLKRKRKLFCKYCYSPKLKVLGIKKGVKSVICEVCKKTARWKISSS